MTALRRVATGASVLAALAACDQGHPKPLPTTTTGSATVTARDASLADAAAPDVAVTHGSVTLPAKPTLGCLGWAPAAKAAACITGNRLSNQPSVYTLQFVTSGEPAAEPIALHTTMFDEAFEDADITRANTALAQLGVEPLTEAAQPIDKPGVHLSGKTVKLTWTSKLTNPGGDNIAPTHAHEVVARCGARTYELAATESEGVDPVLEYRMIDGRAIVETSVVTGREGEYGAAVSVLVLDFRTCNAAQSAN